jgi:hypothetical protein
VFKQQNPGMRVFFGELFGKITSLVKASAVLHMSEVAVQLVP